jgi:hypothetical protein
MNEPHEQPVEFVLLTHASEFWLLVAGSFGDERSSGYEWPARRQAPDPTMMYLTLKAS